MITEVGPIEVTQDELIKLVCEKKGANFVSLVSSTDPRMRKTGNPYKDLGIRKLARLSGCLGWIYELSVNRQRIRENLEPDFESEPRVWGKRRPGTPLIEHSGKLYLELKVEKLLEMQFRDKDGNLVDPEVLKPFLPERESESKRQQVEREIVLRDIEICNIRELRMNSQIYLLKS